MIFGSICSGIEAATVAWEPLGWRCAFMSEIDKFPRALLAHHYPGVPLHGDFTTIKAGDYAAIDVLVGGTPCQSFSIAGLRGGLEDARGNLALEYLRLAGRLRPRWVVWENVPGVLSSGGGRDFGAFLGGLVELGYGFAYRVLDAQYFGLAQRRKRVFVVGCLGDWRRAAAVLFEPASLRGDTPPRRQTGQGVAPTISARPTGGGGLGTDFDCDGGLVPAIAMCLNAHPNGIDGESETFVAHTLRGEGLDAGEGGGGKGTPLVPVVSSGRGWWNESDVGATIRAQDSITKADTLSIDGGGLVRRLTPRECERLQGFPDDYTLIPWRKGMAADGPRYKALGNSMAVPVMRWIGQRIERAS